MKYKVTTKGWVVLGIMLIISIALIVPLFSNDNELPNEGVNLDENVGSDLENNDNSNIEDNESNQTSDISDSNNTTNESETIEESETSNESSETSSEEIKDESNETSSEESKDESNETSNEESKEIRHYDFESYELTIHYGKNIYDLNHKYFDYLKEIKLMLDSDDNKKVVIEGHINGFPSYTDGSYGLNISLMRAEAVRIYLTSIGVSEDDIVIINKGSSDQVEMSKNIKNHYLNRRAYIYFENKEN